MRSTPIFNGAIALALRGSVLRADSAIWQNTNIDISSNERGIAQMVDYNVNVTHLRHGLTVMLV